MRGSECTFATDADIEIKRQADRNENFLPWLLGSQACEKTFRTVHSMTGMFSTMINFSMLNLLQKMHKLDVLKELQSVSEKQQHCILFPRQDRYSKGKEGSETLESY